MDKSISAATGLILAMCYIIDEYQNFNENLNNFKRKNKLDENLSEFIDITRGKKVWGFGKLKKFYEENKTVIDKINEVSYISNFICFDEERRKQIYEYLIKNRDKLNSIIKNLEKLKALGINNVEIDDKFDFTSEEYKIYDRFNRYLNTKVTYLDNIKIVPKYDSNTLEYKTTNSDYKLVIGGWPSVVIYVNNLFFDETRLPDTINARELCDIILSKKEEKKEEISAIRDSVNLSLGIEDLASMLDDMDRIVDRLDDFDDKGKVVELLSDIRNNVTKIEDISKKYDNDMIQHYNNEIITEKNLDREKRLEKSRRFMDSLHYD